MRNRAYLLIDAMTRHNVFAAAARMISFAVLAAAVLCPVTGLLVLEDPQDKTRYAGYEMTVGDGFSVGFIHSVNNSPVTDYFEIREDGIYGVKSKYYGFGAGVQTELEDGQTLTYGEDGSMIISGYEMKMNQLIYRAGTVSDHILTLPDGREISLRDLCGRSARVGFRFEPDEETDRSPAGKDPDQEAATAGK